MAQPFQRLRDLAEDQWGLVTLEQARNAGVARSSISRLTTNGLLEHVARGVYRLRGSAEPDLLALRAAWLQLDPAQPAWARLDDPDVALVSHASAAAVYGVGDLRADVHEFTVHQRRQSRRPDVRLHRGQVPNNMRLILLGLPITRAARMIGDLVGDNVDPDAVAQVVREVLDAVYDYPSTVAQHLAPYAARFGFRRGDGLALLNEFLTKAAHRHRDDLLAEARAGLDRAHA